MKTLLLTRNSAYKIDPDTKKITFVNKDVTGVDDVTLIDEDCDVLFTYYDPSEKSFKTMSKTVKAGDIVVTFFRDFKHKFVVVRSDEWVENITQERARAQKEKEDWAAAKIKQNSVTEENKRN